MSAYRVLQVRRAVLNWMVAGALATICSSWAGGIGGVGVNKFDLFLQYLGFASGGDGSERYRRVTLAMARKSIADAADAGIPFMRVAVTGYGPAPLERLINDPDGYWRLFDQMLSEMRESNVQLVPVFVWNAHQIPERFAEDVGTMIRDHRSRSFRFLSDLIRTFVIRYKDHPSVLFYEATNELNLLADLDNVTRCRAKKPDAACAAAGNFSTDELIVFGQRVTKIIRGFDPNRLVSSGFSIPRRSAEHLRRFGPRAALPREAWEDDTEAEFVRNLLDIHQGFDIISIHLYPTDNNRRFTRQDPIYLLDLSKQAADRARKALFVGEFGDPRVCLDGAGPFISQVLQAIERLRIPYAAVWVWQFYQKKPYITCDNPATMFNVEPAFNSGVVDELRGANAKYGRGMPRITGSDTTPPRIVVTWPLECSVLEGNQRIHAVASDDQGGVEQVEFLLSGKHLATLKRPPFAMSISTDELRGGDQLLVARTRDRAGNSSEYVTAVRVGRSVPSDYCERFGPR